jgi:hypothetical protein
MARRIVELGAGRAPVWLTAERQKGGGACAGPAAHCVELVDRCVAVAHLILKYATSDEQSVVVNRAAFVREAWWAVQGSNL